MTIQAIERPTSAEGTEPVACADAVVVAVGALISWLGKMSTAGDAAAGIDRIAALERLQAAAAGAQLVEIAQVAQVLEEAGRAEGRPDRRPGVDVAAQIALARKVSPSSAARQLAQLRLSSTTCRPSSRTCAQVRSQPGWPASS